MATSKPRPTKLPDLSWLSKVAESSQPLSELRPIWVKHLTLFEGPAGPRPERHPYCEIGIELRGRGVLFAETDQAERRPGDIFLAGPAVPHCEQATKFPLEAITVYFLPAVLFELGPESDGQRLLRRFTAHQSVHDLLVRPSAAQRRKLEGFFREIAAEFEASRFGREIRLRTLLMELLVALLRYEQAAGRLIGVAVEKTDWRPVHKTLQYLGEHYGEEIYARDLARAAGLSESRLKVLFHQALGMSWVKYLQGYRIHRAAALLSQPGTNVTEAAMAVGFESLSHFNAVFRSLMGVPPKLYGKTAPRRAEGTAGVQGPVAPAAVVAKNSKNSTETRSWLALEGGNVQTDCECNSKPYGKSHEHAYPTTPAHHGGPARPAVGGSECGHQR
jgi:AraC-like DNA-binding protein